MKRPGGRHRVRFPAAARLAYATFVALMLAGGVGEAAPPASIIHRSMGSDPPSLDPNLGSGGMAAPPLSDLVEGLVGRGPSLQPEPGAAERWQLSDDRLTWTFHLRDGLKWSDGRALTAGDFVWSYRRLLDPATAALSAGLYLPIRNARRIIAGELSPERLGVSASDARTVIIELEYPTPYFLQLLANTQAVPVPRHAVEAHGRDWTRPGNYVGNGPYVLADRIPQTHIHLVRNPHFHAAGAVRIDEVYWYPTQDLGAAFRRFRAGDIDVVLNVGPDDLDWVRRNAAEVLHTGPMHATWVLVLNTARPPFDDERVRRALALAVDRDAIANRLLKTGVRPAWSFVSPGIGGYRGYRNPDAGAAPAVRLVEARRLLTAAGFGPERPLVVPLLYDTHEENRKIVVAIASMWQQVGVRTDATNVEFGALLGAQRAKNYAVARSQTFSLYDDPYAFLQQYTSRSPSNWAGWSDARYDDLLVRANASADPAERLTLLEDAEARLLAAQPVIPIYHYQSKVLVSPRVKGWWDAPIGTPPTRYLSLDDAQSAK